MSCLPLLPHSQKEFTFVSVICIPSLFLAESFSSLPLTPFFHILWAFWQLSSVCVYVCVCVCTVCVCTFLHFSCALLWNRIGFAHPKTLEQWSCLHTCCPLIPQELLACNLLIYRSCSWPSQLRRGEPLS